MKILTSWEHREVTPFVMANPLPYNTTAGDSVKLGPLNIQTYPPIQLL